MGAEVLLDCQGDLPVPPSYQIIDTEVGFLRHATEDQPLLVRGERLCAWAEAFYSLRGRPYRYQESLSAVLLRVFPALSQEQAGRLARKLGPQTALSEPVSAALVLSRCYPDAYTLWRGVPSPQHAARWLLWLYENAPDDAEAPLLRRLALQLEQQAGDAPESAVYRVATCEEAASMLRRWLGAEEPKLNGLGEIPVKVPDSLLKEIKTDWMRRLIESKGAYFTAMLDFPLPVWLRQELAQLTARYCQQNPTRLSCDLLYQLQPYLDTQTLTALQQRLPPPVPSGLPQEPPAVLEWFRTSYLPYRRWQARFGDAGAREQVIGHGQAFSLWYLARYPALLLQGDWLSFQRADSLSAASSEYLTLCVVLDGLPAWDAVDFVRALSSQVERLQLLQESYCFATIPTVTEFAKEALLRGVPPNLAPEHPALGRVLPDKSSPLHELRDIDAGEVVFWRVAQPDAAYHFESSDKRERQVRAELGVILQAIGEVTEHLPADVPLWIVITSDHGRLLNANAPRRLAVPDGMTAHGRVAWGHLHQEFGESGFAVNENAGTIAVHGERFEMAHDMLIAWGEESFGGANGGHEPYPHGGLFPEEVIVPWFVLVRDAEQPSLDISVTGKGEEGNAASLAIGIINLGRVALECLAVSLSTGVRVRGNWSVLPLSQTEFSISVNPWPAKSDLETLRAELLFRQPNGALFRREITPELIVETLYERDDSIFEELGL